MGFKKEYTHDKLGKTNIETIIKYRLNTSSVSLNEKDEKLKKP